MAKGIKKLTHCHLPYVSVICTDLLLHYAYSSMTKNISTYFVYNKQIYLFIYTIVVWRNHYRTYTFRAYNIIVNFLSKCYMSGNQFFTTAHYF